MLDQQSPDCRWHRWKRIELRSRELSPQPQAVRVERAEWCGHPDSQVPEREWKGGLPCRGMQSACMISPERQGNLDK